MIENVPNIAQNVTSFNTMYKNIVHELITIRKNANVTQDFMADWLQVDRRKIIAFENFRKIDFQILLVYADKLSVSIELNFKIN